MSSPIQIAFYKYKRNKKTNKSMEMTFLKAKIRSQNRIWASIWYKRIEALAMVKTELMQNICNLAKLAPHTAFTLFCNALLTCMCRHSSVVPTFVESATSTDRHIFWNPLLTNTKVLSLSWTYLRLTGTVSIFCWWTGGRRS